MKKTVIAFYVSTNENIVKAWTCRVRSDIDMIDVTVPINTVFSFFSTSEEVNYEVVQIKLLNNLIDVDMSIFKNYISEQKIFCYGFNQNGSLVVRNPEVSFVLEGFVNQVKKQNFNIEYI